MIGTIANIAAVAAGGTVGLIVHSRLPSRLISIVFQGMGLVTIAIGVSMSLKSDSLILAIISIVTGAIIGELLRLEERLESSAEKLKHALKSNDNRFTEGLVTASMLYCVGSMAILGSIEDGLGMKPQLLFTKSIMDCISAVALAASFGVGVLFSIIPILVFQGLITLFASYLSDFMSESMIADMTCVGGILLIGLGLSILNIKKISIVNMLPALIMIVFLSYLREHMAQVLEWF